MMERRFLIRWEGGVDPSGFRTRGDCYDAANFLEQMAKFLRKHGTMGEDDLHYWDLHITEIAPPPEVD